MIDYTTILKLFSEKMDKTRSFDAALLHVCWRSYKQGMEDALKDEPPATGKQVIGEVRIQRMLEGLGHTDIIEALKHAEDMRSALHVIHTWANFPEVLEAEHVKVLTKKALRME